MAEQVIYPFWEQNKQTKPMIEDVMPHYLDGDNLKVALDFMAYLRENKIKPTWTSVQNGWSGMCKGKVLYWIRLPQVKSHLDANESPNAHFRNIKQSSGINWTNSWIITPYFNHLDTYGDIIASEGLDNFFIENLHLCRPNCSSSVQKPGNKWCLPGVSKNLLGKEVQGICRGDLYSTMTAWFVNPCEVKIGYIKRLLELEIQARKQ
ncbi:MAG: hypothetical protein FWC89_14030 [Defluviitaleaceae bacterium]|nr:hypothetical protein [Defluviitaleaceae bacterium]